MSTIKAKLCIYCNFSCDCVMGDKGFAVDCAYCGYQSQFETMRDSSQIGLMYDARFIRNIK
jgi:hypothetical protein